jgi:hypothetical protein
MLLKFENRTYGSEFMTILVKHIRCFYSVDFEYIYIYIYTTSEKPVDDQSYGVLDRYGIAILYK